MIRLLCLLLRATEAHHTCDRRLAALGASIHSDSVRVHVIQTVALAGFASRVSEPQSGGQSVSAHRHYAVTNHPRRHPAQRSRARRVQAMHVALLLAAPAWPPVLLPAASRVLPGPA